MVNWILMELENDIFYLCNLASGSVYLLDFLFSLIIYLQHSHNEVEFNSFRFPFPQDGTLDNGIKPFWWNYSNSNGIKPKSKSSVTAESIKKAMLDIRLMHRDYFLHFENVFLAITFRWMCVLANMALAFMDCIFYVSQNLEFNVAFSALIIIDWCPYTHKKEHN